MSKLSQTYGVTYQNLGEKGTKPPEKNQVNRAYQFWKKSKKLPQITRKSSFAISGWFGVVFWIFLRTGKPYWINFFSGGLVPFSPKFW